MARAGTRLALPCPGRSAVGAPLLVSWLCTDCGRGPGQITIAEYSQDGTVSLLVDPGRIQLVRHSFQLVLDPTSISDTGTYVCRINNSPTPDYIKVVVQGTSTARLRCSPSDCTIRERLHYSPSACAVRRTFALFAECLGRMYVQCCLMTFNSRESVLALQ